ncbi:MAG: hypothetical protein EBR86_00475 [Planctomycetia bacterium]|nr:hypothetical protein [Planctomycetia bacterium]
MIAVGFDRLAWIVHADNLVAEFVWSPERGFLGPGDLASAAAHAQEAGTREPHAAALTARYDRALGVRLRFIEDVQPQPLERPAGKAPPWPASPRKPPVGRAIATGA